MFNVEINITRTVYYNHGADATLYTLKTLFFKVNICKRSVYK
jgi:hypothetical protein